MGKRNNGEGTFVTLGPNKIVHKICIGKNSNGKPKFLSVTGTTKADCKRKMKARLDSQLPGGYPGNCFKILYSNPQKDKRGWQNKKCCSPSQKKK